MATAWLFLLWSGLSFVVALQARRPAGRVPTRVQLALGLTLHAAGVLTMLGAVHASSWHRMLPGLVLAGIGSGLLTRRCPCRRSSRCRRHARRWDRARSRHCATSARAPAWR